MPLPPRMAWLAVLACAAALASPGAIDPDHCAADDGSCGVSLLQTAAKVVHSHAPRAAGGAAEAPPGPALARDAEGGDEAKAVPALALVAPASALNLVKNNATMALDINQKAYIEGSPVLGDGTGSGALNECRAFPDYMVSDPRKPEVKVCGTGIKMTVFLLGRCGQMSTGRALPSSGMAKQWVVGACDKGLDAKTCRSFSPGDDKRFGAAQSYKIEQC